MLKPAFQYSYINAKIRSLKSQLLIGSDYEQLARISGYTGIVESLKTTSYGQNWKQAPSSFEGLIQLYYENLFAAYKKVIKALSGKRKQLVQHLYQKYELENLKLILRTVCRKERPNEWKHLLLPTIEPESFSVKELQQAKTLEEILLRLKGSWYYEPLQNALHRFEQEKETFPLEMALDLSYYSRLWQLIDLLGSKDRRIARSLIGVQFDALNIIWIFRFKEIHHFSPEESLNYSLMHGAYLSPDIRLKLAYSIDYEEMVQNLEGTPYKNILAEVQDPEAGYARLLSYSYSVARKNWQQFPFQIGTVLDYLFFKEMEIKNLISLTETKRLNLPQSRVKELFIAIR